MCLNIEQNGNWEDDDPPSMVGVPLSFETEPFIVHCISLLDWMETIRYFCAAELLNVWSDFFYYSDCWPITSHKHDKGKHRTITINHYAKRFLITITMIINSSP